MSSPGKRCAVGLAALALSFVPLGAFSHAAVGSKIANRQMPALAGGHQPLLGDAPANVFIFIRPDREHSRQVLEGVAGLEEEMAGRSVYWTAVVSDRFPAGEVRAVVEEVGLRMPVLIDEGDALYGELGAALHPVLGITDRDHVLVVYQPFRKVNFIELLRARIRHPLGEISGDELALVENPPKTDLGGDDAVARRRLRLARMLRAAGKEEKALESVMKSLENDPELAEAFALAGSILAGQGECAAALEAFERALSLDPTEPTALEGKRACQGDG